jgi:hypothetical protein
MDNKLEEIKSKIIIKEGIPLFKKVVHAEDVAWLIQQIINLQEENNKLSILRNLPDPTYWGVEEIEIFREVFESE